ncbi:ChaN family lipoprotein [Marinobacter apostichopi]|uniref:ChaN family lipoprotein n=1 Tax=Marinobacter apostichopi TaxID=3035454 RepID=UPI002572C107|nr:ChaN family lipoprotein [Marinobacter sp. LA51]
MKLLTTPLLLITLTALAGCATRFVSPPTLDAPETQYHATIVNADTATSLSVTDLAEAVAQADVVVVGEYHGHHGSHLLQSRLQAALYQQNPALVLTMEQFDQNRQRELDRYLAGETGEAELIEDAGAWDNYRASYRPLIEFAKARAIPVIAANAPSQVVRCVGRQGPDYLDTLPADVRAQLPANPFTDTPGYREKFVTALAGGHSSGEADMNERMQNTYKAQLLRDNVMAMQIQQARKRYPRHQILHLTGTFHSEERLGTVALLKQRAPELGVVVLTPVFWPAGQSQPDIKAQRGKGDYLYFLQTLPKEYRDAERARAAMSVRFSQAKSASCE